ncbi:MAG: hypothetical protein IBX71_03730 [Candidatus Desulforudis sp.]|nr:hypothetical protein [Desulforudis sp.]
MVESERLYDAIRAQLINARRNGHSKQELVLNGRRVWVGVESTPLRILVCTGPSFGAEENAVTVLDTARRLLGNPPDAVFTRGKRGEQPVDYCAVWGNPKLSFHEELSSLIPEIYAPKNLVKLLSGRLRAYLVPEHPREWAAEQIDLWRRFWTLRLEDPTHRERIEAFSHPNTWEYFDVLSGRLAALATRRITEMTDTPVSEPSINELYRVATLTGYHLYLLGHPQPLDFRKVDFLQVSKLVAEHMAWENIPNQLLQVINEINVSDIRASGDLFRQAVLLPPAVLDRLLLEANKSAALGYTTAAVADRLTGHSC